MQQKLEMICKPQQGFTTNFSRFITSIKMNPGFQWPEEMTIGQLVKLLSDSDSFTLKIQYMHQGKPLKVEYVPTLGGYQIHRRAKKVIDNQFLD